MNDLSKKGAEVSFPGIAHIVPLPPDDRATVATATNVIDYGQYAPHPHQSACCCHHTCACFVCANRVPFHGDPHQPPTLLPFQNATGTATFPVTTTITFNTNAAG